MKTFEQNLDMPLDKGIRDYVLTLKKHGINTIQSCEGGKGHACPEPIVAFSGDESEGFRAFAIAVENHLPVREIQFTYQVTEGKMLKGPYWQMVFKYKAKHD